MDVDFDILSSPPHERAPTAVGIGVFDGVHLAHRKLIDHVVGAARSTGCAPCILTFCPHPEEALTGRQVPHLTTLEERLALIASHGVTRCAVARFSEEFSRLTPEVFAREVLVHRLDARAVVVGFNFRFGHHGAGTVETLGKLGRRLGFEVTVMGPIQIADQTVSSSAIRSALGHGQVELAATMLGRPYALVGMVAPGAGRGHRLGFPTANLQVDPARVVVPRPGVYCGVARPAGGEHYPALVNVGIRPTFEGDRGALIPEVYLHGFSGTLAGRSLAMLFQERLRDEVRFPSADALVVQLQADLDQLRLRISRGDYQRWLGWAADGPAARLEPPGRLDHP
ncbi:MAG: riboflavin biosynthesis protein RibF [Candidatus Riflebacteria bacterium]|nr:riboflavin biosynthesis protein RibF [Candidatus Riflebacteria bacterium]